MIAPLLALLLAAQAGPGLAPPPGKAPPVVVTAPAPDPAELTKTAQAMQEMYDLSCASREWGAYDDMCNGIRQQVKEARVAAEKATRDAARARRAAATRP